MLGVWDNFWEDLLQGVMYWSKDLDSSINVITFAQCKSTQPLPTFRLRSTNTFKKRADN